jgi:uncharacterized protein YecE (DUF72 family)
MIFIGTSGYAYKEWKGSFYPEDLPAKAMLRYYAEHFRAVEINNTFYKLPAPETARAWLAEVPKDFVFALKAPQQITHFKRLKSAGDPTRDFLRFADGFGSRLGPLLFQLPPNMKKDVPRLAAYIKLLPRDRRVTFEFRHESWFDDETFDALRAHGAAVCIAESDDLETPLVSTAGWGYLRLRRAAYSPAGLKARAKDIAAQAWSDTYVFFKHEDTGTGPMFAKKLIALTG